ncbi:MAG: carboxymuconolactone decarboxylase family protein [Chloroflexi bacterium]|nr:carboxymuconolactone decarboxylase family protein [Chloroflexota bacterium]
MSYLPRPYTRFRKEHPKLDEAYEKFSLACHEAGPLDERTRRLVKLGIAIGAGSEGAVKSHARRAMEMGVSREEVRHACLLALTTVGFPAMIAALEWMEEVPTP